MKERKNISSDNKRRNKEHGWIYTAGKKNIDTRGEMTVERDKGKQERPLAE